MRERRVNSELDMNDIELHPNAGLLFVSFPRALNGRNDGLCRFRQIEYDSRF